MGRSANSILDINPKKDINPILPDLSPVVYLLHHGGSHVLQCQVYIRGMSFTEAVLNDGLETGFGTKTIKSYDKGMIQDVQ